MKQNCTLKELLQMVEMQKTFADLYSRTGMIAVSEGYIQMRCEEFKDIFEGMDWKVEEHSKCYDKLTVEFMGVKFIALADKPREETPSSVEVYVEGGADDE